MVKEYSITLQFSDVQKQYKGDNFRIFSIAFSTAIYLG